MQPPRFPYGQNSLPQRCPFPLAFLSRHPKSKAAFTAFLTCLFGCLSAMGLPLLRNESKVP